MVPFPHLATGGEQGCPILVLKKAQQAGKQPGCEYWGISFSGRKGFAVYKNGKLVERYLMLYKLNLRPIPTVNIKGFSVR